MNVRGLLVGFWLFAALLAGVGAWRFEQHRFLLNVVAALFVVGAFYVATTKIDGGDS